MDTEKRYLEEGDEIIADFVYFELTNNNELKNPQLGDCSFWHDGMVANRDENGLFYVFEEIKCIN